MPTTADSPRGHPAPDIYKIYAESFRDEAHLKQIQQEAQNAIAGVFESVKAPDGG